VFVKNGPSSKDGCSSWVGVSPATVQAVAILANNVVTGKKYETGINGFANELFTALTGVPMGKG
jgi:hypothetical protein